MIQIPLQGRNAKGRFAIVDDDMGDGWYWFENEQILPVAPEFIELAEEKGLLTVEGLTQSGTMTGYVRMQK